MFIFFTLSTQHLVWIVTGTGIVFTVIFYIGTKEPAIRPLRKISTFMDPVVWNNIRYRLLCPRRLASSCVDSPWPWTIRNHDWFLSQESVVVTLARMRMIATLFHCNAVLRWKSLLLILPYNFTFSPVLYGLFLLNYDVDVPARFARYVCINTRENNLSWFTLIFMRAPLIAFTWTPQLYPIIPSAVAICSNHLTLYYNVPVAKSDHISQFSTKPCRTSC